MSQERATRRRGPPSRSRRRTPASNPVSRGPHATPSCSDERQLADLPGDGTTWPAELSGGRWLDRAVHEPEGDGRAEGRRERRAGHRADELAADEDLGPGGRDGVALDHQPPKVARHVAPAAVDAGHQLLTRV